MKTIISTILIVLVFISCSKNETSVRSASDASNTASSPGETDFSIFLTDDPGNYDHVFLDIVGAEVHYIDDENNKWYTFKNFHGGVYNILRFTNGKDTLLANNRISAKRINQVRLILGDDNTVVVDGITYPLTTPSGQKSGIKVNVDITLTEGVKYEIWTDFDVQKSIVVTGNNEYILKPTYRVYTNAITGSLNGIVQPNDANAWVYVMSDNHIIASTRPDKETGAFMVNGSNPGSYKVLIDGSNGYQDKKYKDVAVSIQNVTGTGTTVLHQ